MLVLVLALSQFTHKSQVTQQCRHKRKHKKKERFPFLVLAFMLALMFASARFTRWFLMLYAYA